MPNDSQRRTISSSNMVEGNTKQSAGLDSHQVCDDASHISNSAHGKGANRLQSGFRKKMVIIQQQMKHIMMEGIDSQLHLTLLQ